jgi:hypothetical protein
MATLRIPVRRDIFDYTLELEAIGLTLRIYYNARIDTWIADVPNEVLSISLLGGVDLFSQYRHKNLPTGELRIIDLDGKNRDPTKTNFGDRIILAYVEA